MCSGHTFWNCGVRLCHLNTSAEKYRIHAFQVLLLCNNSWNSCDLTLECERCQKPNTMKIGLLTLALLGRPCYCLHNDPFVCKSRQRRASKLDFFQNCIWQVNFTYRIVMSTNTCYYSENQVFGGVTIRVLCCCSEYIFWFVKLQR